MIARPPVQNTLGVATQFVRRKIYFLKSKYLSENIVGEVHIQGESHFTVVPLPFHEVFVGGRRIQRNSEGEFRAYFF